MDGGDTLGFLPVDDHLPTMQLLQGPVARVARPTRRPHRLAQTRTNTDTQGGASEGHRHARAVVLRQPDGRGRHAGVPARG